MNLYLDLNKGQGVTSVGTTTKKEPQSITAYKESFVSSPSGVANDGASYDDPKVGKKWKHGESDSEEVELQADREKQNKEAQDQNLVPTPEEVGMKKAFDLDALDMVKSLTSGLRDQLNLHKLSATEAEFLHLVKGFSHEEINRGRHTIVGKDRALFSRFLCEKALSAVDDLYRR